MTLDNFEMLVQTQQPAGSDWKPVTDYTFEARATIEGDHPRLIKDVFKPTSVIDAGCGPGHLVRLLRQLDVNAQGFDVNPPTHPAVVCRGVLRYGDLASDEPHWMRADLVICREVLEHLTVRHIRKAVQNLCWLASKYVYVTTRFNESPRSIWDVQTSDDLDPTHISLLPKDLLRSWFVLEGFTRRADLEDAMDWQQKHRCLVYARG